MRGVSRALWTPPSLYFEPYLPAATPRGMGRLEELSDNLLVAYTVWVVVGSTSAIGPQTGAPSEQMASVLEKLAETVTSRQNYSFAGTMRALPDAVRELGWVVDQCVSRATQFLATLRPPVEPASVYGLARQEGSTVLLLSCYGHVRAVETPPVPAERFDAIETALRVLSMPRRLMPDLFGDSAVDGGPTSAPGWNEHGPGDVAAYFNSRLDETAGGLLSAERAHFAGVCVAAVRGAVSRIEAALNRGQSVSVPLWGVESVSCRGAAAKISARLADGTGIDIASGPAWVVSAAQLPSDTAKVEVEPEPGAVLSLCCG
jgi:hypothetical protein